MKFLLRPIAVGLAAVLASAPLAADTLRDIYELALQNDPKLKTAEAVYRANLEIENQALAAMLPQVSGSAEYSKKDVTEKSERFFEFNGAVVPSRSDDDTKSDSRTYTISLQQKIFDLATWFSFKSGKETSKQAEAQFAYDQQALIVRVAEAYFNVLRALDNLRASQAEERATQRQLEQTQQRFDVGLIAITDVHEAQAAYDAVVVQRLTDEGNLATAYETLTTLTGQSHSNLWLLNKDFPVANPEPYKRSEWVDFALTNNYLLKASQFDSEAARQNATAKKMEHLPKITGSYAYNDFYDDGDSNSNLNGINKPFETESEGSTISVQLTMPLFTGGLISAQRRQAYEQYNAAFQTSIDTQRTVIQNTRALHIGVTTDVQRVKAREQAIVSSQSALDATQAGYEVGTRNIVDVLQAQRTLFASLRDYANARYDYVINLLKLKQAAGTLSPQDIYDLNKWLLPPEAPTANTYKDYQ